MGLFKDAFEGIVGGALSAASRAAAGSAPGRPVQAADRVEQMCRQLGWAIDGRVGPGGYLLRFSDPLSGGTRDLLVACGESIVVLTASSSASFRQGTLPADIPGYLLRRNGELVLPAWRADVEGDAVGFTLAYGALVAGMDAAAFDTVCRTICKEVSEFDAQLRRAGLV